MDLSIIIPAICNQACFVETPVNSLLGDMLRLQLPLPKCLISNGHHLLDIIVIYPMISKEKSDKRVNLIRTPSGAYLFIFHDAHCIKSSIRICSQYDLDNVSKYLATFMYADNNCYESTMTIYPGVIGNCKKILRNKMVQNLVELYFVKYMCLASLISRTEIKIILIEMFIEIEKWNNLEIC